MIREAIDGCKLFQDLSPSERAAPRRGGPAAPVPRRQLPLAGRRPEDGLHLVVAGFVHIGIVGPDAEKIALHLVAPGDCMGEARR